MSTFDFDAAQRSRNEGRGFILRGERFPVHDVSFDVVNEWEDSDPTGTAKGNTDQTIDFVCEFLEEDDVDRFRELLKTAKERKEPITTGDLLALTRWLLEQHTARPTMQPGSSGRGQVKMPGGSAAEPLSPVATRGG